MNKQYTDAVMKLGEPTKKNVATSFYLGYKCKMTTNENKIFVIVLLPEEFLQFDWLRAVVFQLNLKHLHVKITVTMETQNHQIMSSHELRKNGGKILKITRIKNWNKIRKTKIMRKVHRPGSMFGPAGSKTRTSKPICSPTKRNNSKKINSWR